MIGRCPEPCGNQIDSTIACDGCSRVFGYCPEHGGESRARHHRAQHEAVHDPDAKQLTCRWCTWKSSPFKPFDRTAQDRAFGEQRAHVAARHPEVMKKIQAWINESARD